MALFEMIVVLHGRNIQTPIRDNPTFIQRVFGMMFERNKGVITLAIGKVEGCNPARRFDRGLARPFQPLGQRRKFALAWRAVEPADTDIDGMDLSPAQKLQNFIANFLQLEPA